jgi:formate dehydrogenase major subunit
MVVFMNEEDRIARCLEAGARVALETITDDGVLRRVDGLTLLDYPMSRGAIAGYYPELNPLLPLEYHDRTSGTPAAKSIPVRVVASSQAFPPDGRGIAAAALDPERTSG